MGEPFDTVSRRELLEMALRPLGALGGAAEFPQDREGIEELIGRLPKRRPSERKRFAYEDPEALPRYDGEYTVWLAPAGDGALRLRRERFRDLTSVAVVLHPDGRVGEFEEIEGFGVPDSELDDQARADREAHERQLREEDEAEPKYEERREEREVRFRTGNLIRAVAGPAGQDPSGPMVAYLTLYETGVMVNYLVPKPPNVELFPDDRDDPFAEPLEEAMFPRLELDDGLGTDYKVVDLSHVDMTSSPLRARLDFEPAVPAAARALRVIFESVTVEIGLEER
jgi:hypothetical protein